MQDAFGPLTQLSKLRILGQSFIKHLELHVIWELDAFTLFEKVGVYSFQE